ncbi:unnamed protein product [Victoria cruziana]
MSAAAAAAASTYLARRAAQKQRVRILYRRTLKDTLDWVVHRHLFYQEASDLREKFEANRHVNSIEEDMGSLISSSKCLTQITALFPMKTQYLKIDLLLSGSPVQSACVCEQFVTSLIQAIFGINQPIIKEDVDAIDRMLDEAEARFGRWRHPDPYIVPWAPGGSKFCRNPAPPPGIEIVYDFGKEDNY